MNTLNYHVVVNDKRYISALSEREALRWAKNNLMPKLLKQARIEIESIYASPSCNPKIVKIHSYPVLN